MKFDFTVEDREDGAYITNIVPNDRYKVPLPCKVVSINYIKIKTSEEFHAAYKNAAEGDHQFLLAISYNAMITYYAYRITK